MVLMKHMLLSTVVLLMSGCMIPGIPGMSGGTNVAANTQVGAENNQTVGGTTHIDPQTVDTLTINNTDISLVLLLMVVTVIGVIGWVLPTPMSMIRRMRT